MKFKGYSLIEVLVVMSIIGVLFTLGYASYRDFSRRQTLVGLAKQVEGDLRLAQQMALSGEKPESCAGKTLEGVQFGVTTSSPYNYKIRSVCGTGPGFPIIKSYDFNTGISFDFGGFSINPVIFKTLASGTNIPAGSVDTLVIKDAFGNYSTIIIDSGGSITLK